MYNYITTESSINHRLFPNNKKNDYHYRLIYPFKGAEYEIAVLSVYLDKVIEKPPQNIICIYLGEQCVLQYDMQHAHQQFYRLLFHKLPEENITQLHITLKQVDGKLINLPNHTKTIIKFVTKLKEDQEMKLVQFNSNTHTDIYNNTPFDFTNKLSEFEWGETTFNNYEIALESILIPKKLLKKLGEGTIVLNVLTNIEILGQASKNFKYSIEDIPIPYKLDSTYFFYKPPSLRYQKINHVYLSKMTIHIRGNYKDETLELTEEEKKEQIQCTFCFREWTNSI